MSYEVTVGSATEVVRAAVPGPQDLRTRGTSALRTVQGDLSIEYAGGGATRMLRRIFGGAPS